MEDKKYELIKFNDGGFSLDVNVSPSEDTVWLTLDEIGALFERDRSVIGKHIKNIINNSELNINSVRANFAHTASDGKIYITKYYNLDMIIAVGYRVKSNRGILFQKWALKTIDDIKDKKAYTTPLIVFEHNGISLDVNVSPNEDTVWLTKDQITILYDTTRQNIEYHINNIYEENELESRATCKEILQVQNEKNRKVTRTVNVYNLDMIGTYINEIGKKRFVIIKSNSLTKDKILK